MDLITILSTNFCSIKWNSAGRWNRLRDSTDGAKIAVHWRAGYSSVVLSKDDQINANLTKGKLQE